MSIGDIIKGWLFKVALKKGIVSAAKLIVSYCASKGLIFVGTMFGVVIDTGNAASIEAALTLGINTLLTIVRNWLKVKFGVTWL
jgi:hypothetical protein